MAGVRALTCPNCGAPVTLRTLGHAITVACGSCATVLDAKDPGLRVLQRARERMRIEPRIPLGTRGTWRGVPREVVGFQVRTITVDDTDYSWHEYLLFNPYHGFRYLTEYDGHWNDVVTLHALPEERTAGGRTAAVVDGTTFRHFQSATARTSYVLGEFPWEARVGDAVQVRDFVAPPRMLSAEETPDEVTWSLGSYTDGASVWRAFGLPGAPPAPRGVYADQPSPHTGLRTTWLVFALLVLGLVGLAVLQLGWTRNERVHAGRYTFDPRAGESQAFVTDPFWLRGRPSNVVVRIESDVDNDWVYFDFALINDATGETRAFGRDVSYYHGVEDGESWSEGSSTDDVVLPTVPAGRYYLRVAPQGNPLGRPVRYQLHVTRDVPRPQYHAIAFVLLLVPPVWRWAAARSFETKRWSESDYPMVATDD